MIPNNTSPHILVIGSTAYDLRKVVFWSDKGANEVRVYFEGVMQAVEIPKTDFETAKLASLSAGG